jgi:hypothetical protein
MGTLLFALSMFLAEPAPAVALKVLAIVGVVFAVIVVIKLLYFGVFILLHPHALGSFAALALLLCLLLMALGVRIRVPQPMAGVPNANLQVNLPNQIPAIHRLPEIPRPPEVPPLRVISAQRVEIAQAENPTAAAAAPSTEKPQPSDSAAAKHSDTASASNQSDPPKWIHDSLPHRESDSWIYIVHLDDTTSPADRYEWLDQSMLADANDYIDRHLYPDQDLSKIVNLNAKYLYDNCLRELYPASGLADAGKEVFARLEFDRKFREEVDRRVHQNIQEEHFRWFSGCVLAGLGLIGGVYTYLRLVPPRQPLLANQPSQSANVEYRSPGPSIWQQMRLYPIRFAATSILGGGLGARLAIYMARSEQKTLGVFGNGSMVFLAAALGAVFFAMLFKSLIGPTTTNRDSKT